uniref:Uncharacterized protein n=1 Tax=Glossina brevipalpis TaxID=37001 RepID=A0A1A9X1F1_9MUSC
MIDESSSSDDDIEIKQFLEATDSTFLNDSLFQKNSADALHRPIESVNNELGICVTSKKSNDLPKSQRYLPEMELSEEGSKGDLILSATIQNASKIDKHKSLVKLLSDADCYVNAYEDFQGDSVGPRKKPKIKRRLIDGEAENSGKAFKTLAVDGLYILKGSDLKYWTVKKERPDKVFYYKMNNEGVLCAKENVNEFSLLRRRNQWNESRIKYRSYDKKAKQTLI